MTRVKIHLAHRNAHTALPTITGLAREFYENFHVNLKDAKEEQWRSNR